MKLRTIKDTVIILRNEDPQTAICENYIRKLIRENKIPHFNSGRRLLINVDDLYSYFQKGETYK